METHFGNLNSIYSSLQEAIIIEAMSNLKNDMLPLGKRRFTFAWLLRDFHSPEAMGDTKSMP
jgi:hypothetical protein